ncbi:hypothetical protein CYY_008392 [Polysphondylium violaceum]|uniref:Uncharacterized protein n=1 Tax=Polysphondylium violaceum TaxID=133409 RepID=A0A8J4PVA3_9MYCE|nr:hypothetical protein CYY_008392 [Polysphondylium violaceum]
MQRLNNNQQQQQQQQQQQHQHQHHHTLEKNVNDDDDNDKYHDDDSLSIDIPLSIEEGRGASIHNDCQCCEHSFETFIDLMLNENPFIKTGFRENTQNSFIECTKSCFQLHNDTLNIWSHLIAALFYIYLFFKSISIILNNNSNSNSDQIAAHDDILFNSADAPSNFNLLFFLFSCFLCFTASSIYHTYRSHSVPVFKKTLLFDVSSIGFLILSSVNLIIDSELSCFPRVKRIFLFSFLFLVFIALSLLPKIMREKKYGMRTLVFTLLALQGIVSHLLKVYMQGGESSSRDNITLRNLLVAYLFFGLGLSIRRLKIPESLWPGQFDIWFSSHQIFHVLVVIGTIFIYNTYHVNYLESNNTLDYLNKCTYK